MPKLKSTSIKQVAIIQKVSTRVAIIRRNFAHVAIIGTILSFPLITFAEGPTLATLAASIAGYMNMALDLLMGFAVVAFVYYVIKYFITANDKRSEAGQYIMYSMIGFFVILSMWGIVNVLINTFNLRNNRPSTWNNLRDLFPSSVGSGGTSNTSNQSVNTSAFNLTPSSASTGSTQTTEVKTSTTFNVDVPYSGSNTNKDGTISGNTQ